MSSDLPIIAYGVSSTPRKFYKHQRAANIASASQGGLVRKAAVALHRPFLNSTTTTVPLSQLVHAVGADYAMFYASQLGRHDVVSGIREDMSSLRSYLKDRPEALNEIDVNLDALLAIDGVVESLRLVGFDGAIYGETLTTFSDEQSVTLAQSSIGLPTAAAVALNDVVKENDIHTRVSAFRDFIELHDTSNQREGSSGGIEISEIYPAIRDDSHLLTELQDRLDDVFGGRIVGVFNHLQGNGATRTQKGLTYQFNFPDGTVISPIYKKAGAGGNIVGVSYDINGFEFNDDLSTSAADLYRSIDQLRTLTKQSRSTHNQKPLHLNDLLPIESLTITTIERLLARIDQSTSVSTEAQLRTLLGDLPLKYTLSALRDEYFDTTSVDIGLDVEVFSAANNIELFARSATSQPPHITRENGGLVIRRRLDGGAYPDSWSGIAVQQSPGREAWFYIENTESGRSFNTLDAHDYADAQRLVDTLKYERENQPIAPQKQVAPSGPGLARFSTLDERVTLTKRQENLVTHCIDSSNRYNVATSMFYCHGGDLNGYVIGSNLAQDTHRKKFFFASPAGRFVELSGSQSKDLRTKIASSPYTKIMLHQPAQHEERVVEDVRPSSSTQSMAMG
jgi:hypothetical protein